MAAISQLSSSSNRLLSAAQFREIHKNTWLKRLNADGKKITVGPKKSEKSWVIFCVHDDSEAFLEGYAEPRQAASHNPEWIISMHNTLHISHALIPNSNEFEFVVTLSNEVIRFHAMSWETMQEWVDTLRSKLREMKILSPRENLYTKLPEARPPLLPTRDPTSPLPLPPPVPAIEIPGVEIIVPPSLLQATTMTTTTAAATISTQSSANNHLNESSAATTTATNTATTTTTARTTTTSTATTQITTTTTNNIPAMSNTSAQNFLNLLTDPMEQLQASATASTTTNSLNLSSSLNDLRLHECSSNEIEIEDCLSPLLRPEHTRTNHNEIKRNSADQATSSSQAQLMDCNRLIPRPHTSRSQSAGAADKSKALRQNSIKTVNSNITALEITTTTTETKPSTSKEENNKETTFNNEENSKTNITIIQVSSTNTDSIHQGNDETLAIPTLPVKNLTTKTSTPTTTAEVFKFPDLKNDKNDVTINATKQQQQKTNLKHSEYKSNVQLIPSNSNVNSSTIKILGESSSSSTTTTTTLNSMPSSSSNQYSTPVRKKLQPQTSLPTTKITTVHVGGGGGGGGGSVNGASVSVYGTCFSTSPSTTIQQSISSSASTSSPMSTPKLPKKIILSANTSGITNITVDNDIKRSSPAKGQESLVRCNVGNVHYEKVFLSSSTPIATEHNNFSSSTKTTTTAEITAISTSTPSVTAIKSSPKRRNFVSPHAITVEQTSTSSTTPMASPQTTKNKTSKAVQTTAISTTDMNVQATSTATSTPTVRLEACSGSPLIQRRGIALSSRNMLTRGLTEAVITTRPSRRDLHFASTSQNTPKHSNHENKSGNKSTVNNNENNEINSEILDQRRRSSSHSDATRGVAAAQRHTTSRGANNNELLINNRSNAAALRFQQPPQPFRNVENSLLGATGVIGGVAASMSPPMGASPVTSKRLTLREQQVMQLRREIMHPGGVRLQLRRKDCIGSIAWVEAFGAIWVAGWKQKEHPVLYNALHIGDQLLSIAGVTISSAAEANKIIRNANTLFVEVLIRRMPFGRGYAIRRDREGQCLGLIRDGNTATIVDVVPNSLAARHGLPPKTQSCDGTSLTFWVITEINGRCLNLFFKENEIRDRLNSVGRDISILVQPSDLITKLKKQLKSLRGYKDYLVQ